MGEKKSYKLFLNSHGFGIFMHKCDVVRCLVVVYSKEALIGINKRLKKK